MKNASKVCYADCRTEIVVADKNYDHKVIKALRRLAVIPAHVSYDKKIEARAYKLSCRKYDDKNKARAFAHFCAMVLGYTLYDGNSLQWAMQQAETQI